MYVERIWELNLGTATEEGTGRASKDLRLRYGAIKYVGMLVRCVDSTEVCGFG